ncbi:autotransporter assembly complex family protein [Rhizobium sp. SSA_523]|uniref:autotransporter assembly complex protein TamA n=1 Tax=Rhizobium sp. SSA_523 TaxID=2952477 RepID=UPI0020914BFE|nr:autotransporter assembly complex family protein [Rhizobium sp. SSA_523]MCO5733620.1 autotransporter assembly complex protein TamA [Rhizobium sp. SSA_523]WKC23083.1 autotransporter assembly complex family protein [Rhizobium sp. SSA_523]
MPEPSGFALLQKFGVIACLAASFCILPPTSREAHALKLFGITLFGSEEEEAADVIDPVRYDASLDTTAAEGELKDRLETATALVNDEEQPVSGDLGLVIKAREDRERLVAILYEEARYGGVVRITIAGTDIDRLPPSPVFDHSAPVPVTVTVEPGPAFTIGQVTLEGDAARLNPADYELESGKPAGSVAIIKAGERIVRDLKAEGRPLAELTRRDVVADHATDQVDITMVAESGPIAPIGAVAVTGSKAVKSDFIRRYSRLDQQERYSPEQLKKAGERLRELGVFSSVTIREADALAPDGSLPLTIEVSEGKFRYFGFGAEYSSIDGAALSGYWGHRNLFGEAESLRIEGKVSGIEATTDYTTFDYSAGIFFRKPGIFMPRITLDASLEAERETPDAYEANTITGKTIFSYELSDLDTVTAGIDISWSKTEDAFGKNTYLTPSLPVTFERDARDNKLDPTEGYRATLKAQPSYETYGGTFFSSFDASASGYLGLGEDDRIVLAGLLSGGTIIGTETVRAIPTTRRYFAGGGGSVRGYGFREISPYNAENKATGGLSYAIASAELRFKITEKIGIVPFFDAGTVSDEIVPDFSDIRMGAGIGLRYSTPFGPLRLDVALPLNRYDGGSRYGIYAGIGQSF